MRSSLRLGDISSYLELTPTLTLRRIFFLYFFERIPFGRSWNHHGRTGPIFSRLLKQMRDTNTHISLADMYMLAALELCFVAS